MKAEDFPDFSTDISFKPPRKSPLDGIEFDGRQPNAYLDRFPIGLKGAEVVQ